MAKADAAKPSLRKRLLSRTSSTTPSSNAKASPADDNSASGQAPLASSQLQPPSIEGTIRNSLDTTSAASHAQPSSSIYRRKGSKLAEGATSQSTLQSSIFKSKSSTSSRKSRKSMLSGVFRKVVPCVGPASYDPPTLPDMSNSAIDGSSSASPAHSSDNATSSGSIAGTNGHRHAPAPLIIPTDDMDADVILPPPPSAKLLPEDETDGVTSGAVQPPGSSIRFHEIPHHKAPGDESDGMITEDESEPYLVEDELAMEERLIRAGGNGIPFGPDGQPLPLLPPISPEHAGRKCLVLDLDETLVHSSFKAIQSPDFIVPVEIESSWHHFHVLKRPGVDTFLKEMGELYEIVVFTASLSKYADPVLDKLDIHKVVKHRLFRESCYSHRGNYVKDLSQLGRPINSTIILDNSPASYIFHNHNAVPVSSWFNDPHDAELLDLVPFLADLTAVEDVTAILDSAR